MSVAKHQACFTTKLQGQNLATFSHSAVMPIAYLPLLTLTQIKWSREMLKKPNPETVHL